MNSLKHLIVEPSKLFSSLKEKPSWLLPFIIVGAGGIILAIFMRPAQTEVSVIKLQETLSPEQIDIALERVQRFGLIGISLLPFFTLLKWVIIGALVLVVTGLFSDKLNFKQSFSIISWGSLILLLGSAVNTGSIYLKGLDTISSPHDLWIIGLNFWGRETVGLPLLLFLSEITVFSVWYLILVALGLTVIANLSRWQAAFVSIFVWLLGVGFKMGLALIGSQVALPS